MLKREMCFLCLAVLLRETAVLNCERLVLIERRNQFDKTKLIYSYKCEVYYGEKVTYAVVVNFTNKSLVVFSAIYTKGYQFAEKEIMEPYLNQFK